MPTKYPSLRQFTHYYRPHRRTIRSVVFVMVTASGLGMLLPYFTSRRLLGITDASFETIALYSLIIMGIILFHHLFWFFWEQIASALTNDVAADIRKDIIAKFMDTRYQEIKHLSSGYYLERITDDAQEVSSFLPNMLGILADCLTNFSFLAVIYALSWPCGLIFTGGIGLMYLIESVRIKRDLRYTEKLKGNSEQFSSKLNENFRGIKDIKALGIKGPIIAATDGISRKMAAVQKEKDQKNALFSRFKTFTQHGVETLLIVFSVGVLMPNHQISVIILLTIINYGGFMYDLVSFIAQIKDWLERGDYKASRILAVLDSSSAERFGDVEALDGHGIDVRHLSYGYDLGDAILSDISFSVQERSAAAFVGASGSGKTTLFGLLSGLLDCEDGRIFVGNRDLNSLSEKCLRDSLCVINQEPFLLNDTILDNIRIVKPDATDGEVADAMRRAHIYEELSGFRGGLSTVVSENGTNLSGGQKQRISIARAILKDAPILLFDEPTSSLDQRNQALILETIMALKQEKTVLVIAHKLDDYAGFDAVYALRDGRIEFVKDPSLRSR